MEVPETLQLKKVDGNWLVNVTKENISEKNLLDEDSDFYNGIFESDEDSIRYYEQIFNTGEE